VKFIYPLLVVLLAVFAVAPLEYPGAFQSQTGLLATYNLINLDQYPLQFFNWAPTVGRAFDLFRTDGPLPYVIAEVFHLIGLGYLDAIKLVYALAWIVSGLTMYALARRFFSQAGALLVAAVYIYLPFHIATIYVRGAFAEAVAWAIFPLALLTVTSRQLSDLSRQTFAFRLLPFSVLFLIQPGMAILFALFAIAISAALHRNQPNDSPFAIRNSLFAIAAGLVLGALLYLPTLFRYGVTAGGDGFNASFIYPFQLFSSLWGFGTSTGSYLDQFPFQLGVVPIGLAIIAVAIGWHAAPAVEFDSTADLGKGKPNDDSVLREAATSSVQTDLRRAVAAWLIAALGLTLLTFEFTAPLWNVLGAFVAYPWQLLTFIGLALALVAGASVEFDARLARPAMLTFFVALPVVASYGYLTPRYIDFTPTRPNIAIFGRNEIALLDYRIVGPLQHGATVRVNTIWQALRNVDHDYTVFVHAVDSEGKTWAQQDARPQDGALPTIKWQPGQVISDTYTIQIDVDGPREGYHLEFGMYVAATGTRALVDTGADQLILPRPGDPEPTISDQLPLPKSP